VFLLAAALAAIVGGLPPRERLVPAGTESS
jgi:hypothetical protein